MYKDIILKKKQVPGYRRGKRKEQEKIMIVRSVIMNGKEVNIKEMKKK